MDKNIVVALIATSSVSLADGLDALLRAIPQIDEVKISRNVTNFLQQVGHRKPHIVLIDSGLLGDQPEGLLEQIRSLAPEIQRVLLVDDVRDVKWMPRYAEAILIKGIPPSAIATIVTNLLTAKGDKHEPIDSNR